MGPAIKASDHFKWDASSNGADRMTSETIAAITNGKSADVFCWFCDEPKWNTFGIAWLGALCRKDGYNSNLNARLPTYVETAQVSLEEYYETIIL